MGEHKPPYAWFANFHLSTRHPLIHPGAQPPNFISDIFYLALASGHYGLQKTIQTLDDLNKEQDEVRRHLDNITADNTWMGVGRQPATIVTR